jgi:hypothetical protein
MTRGFTGAQILGAWNRAMCADEKNFARLLRQSGKFQEQLTAFVIAFTLDMRPEISEAARTVMVCLYEVYRENTASVRQATEAAVEAQWRQSRERIAELEVLVDAGEPIESVIFDHPQPALMTTVLGVLMDVDPEEEDGVPKGDVDDLLELSTDEFWQLLMVMHTVLAVLESHATHKMVA